MGSSSKQKSKTTSSIPKWLEGAAQDNIARGQEVIEANKEFKPYTGDRISGLNANHGTAQSLFDNQGQGEKYSAATSALAGANANRGMIGDSLNKLSSASRGYKDLMGGATDTATNLSSPGALNNQAIASATGSAVDASNRGGVAEGGISDFQMLPGVVAGATDRAEALQLGGGDAQRSMLSEGYSGGTPFMDIGASMAMRAAQPNSPMAISRNMNPFNDAVIDRSLEKFNRERDIDRLSVSDAARRAGAFGGSRHGVVEGEFDRNTREGNQEIIETGLRDSFNQAQQQTNFDRNMGVTAGGALANIQGQKDSRNLSYSDALGSSSARDAALIRQGGQDVASALANRATGSAGLEGQLFNQDIATTGAMRGIGNDYYTQQMGLSNALKSIGDSMWGQGQSEASAIAGLQDQMFGQDMTTSQAWANLANAEQESERAAASDALRMGELERQVDQSQKDFDYQQFMDEKNHPYDNVNFMSGVISATPYSKASTTTTTTPNNNTGNWISAGTSLLGSALMLSDPDEKTNIEDISSAQSGPASGGVDDINSTKDALEAFMKMPMSTYDYKGSAQKELGAPSGRRVGFMADDFAKHFGGDGESVDIPQAIGALAAAVQELGKRVMSSGGMDVIRTA